MTQPGKLRIVWSLVFALAILVSAYVFRGRAAADWVEVGLIGLATVFLVKQDRSSCAR